MVCSLSPRLQGYLRTEWMALCFIAQSASDFGGGTVRVLLMAFHRLFYRSYHDDFNQH